MLNHRYSPKYEKNRALDEKSTKDTSVKFRYLTVRFELYITNLNLFDVKAVAGIMPRSTIFCIS
jgi:hypothetical protein